MFTILDDIDIQVRGEWSGVKHLAHLLTDRDPVREHVAVPGDDEPARHDWSVGRLPSRGQRRPPTIRMCGKLFVPTELVLQKIGLRPPVDVEPRAAS